MPTVRCWHQKSQADAGLGAFPASNVTVRQSYLSSECCNAIMFGSRTEVDMSDFTFEDLILGSVRTSLPLNPSLLGIASPNDAWRQGE